MLNVDFRVKQLRLGHAFSMTEMTLSYLSEHFFKTSVIYWHNTRGSSENFVVPSVGLLLLQRFRVGWLLSTRLVSSQ